MKLGKIKELLMSKENDFLIEIIFELLSKHAMPVFGAAKQLEHEIAAIKVLKSIGYLPEEADEYDYVNKLKVTKSKARSLLYQESLRSNLNIDDEIKKVLQNPTIQKDEKGMYLIEVYNPLIMDAMRKKIRSLGFISDGTFSSSLAKLSDKALVALIEDLVDGESKKIITENLKKQGFTDTSVKGFLLSSLKKIGAKVADETGEEIAKNIGEFAMDIFNDIGNKLASYIKHIGDNK